MAKNHTLRARSASGFIEVVDVAVDGQAARRLVELDVIGAPAGAYPSARSAPDAGRAPAGGEADPPSPPLQPPPIEARPPRGNGARLARLDLPEKVVRSRSEMRLRPIPDPRPSIRRLRGRGGGFFLHANDVSVQHANPGRGGDDGDRARPRPRRRLRAAEARSVEGQLFQRGDVPQRGESARVSDGIVREETSSRRSPRERARGEVFDVIASEVELHRLAEGSQVRATEATNAAIRRLDTAEGTRGARGEASQERTPAVVVQVEDVESRERGTDP